MTDLKTVVLDMLRQAETRKVQADKEVSNAIVLATNVGCTYDEIREVLGISE